MRLPSLKKSSFSSLSLFVSGLLGFVKNKKICINVAKIHHLFQYVGLQIAIFPVNSYLVGYQKG